MPDERADARSRAWPFELTIAGDRRFHQIVGELYTRAAEQVGYPRVDALEIGGAVERTVLGVMEHGFPGHGCEQIDISFAASDDELVVNVRYHALPGDEAPIPARDVEQALAQPRNGEVPLEVIRRAMPRVEFGCDGSVEYCCLARTLPGAA